MIYYEGNSNRETKAARAKRIERDNAIKSSKKAKASCAKAKSKRKKKR